MTTPRTLTSEGITGAPRDGETHEHEWLRVWLGNIPLWTRCRICNIEGKVTTIVEPKMEPEL